MAKQYLYENFNANTADFENRFSEYLNQKRQENWEILTCSYCHDKESDQTWSGCIFKQIPI